MVQQRSQVDRLGKMRSQDKQWLLASWKRQIMFRPERHQRINRKRTNLEWTLQSRKTRTQYWPVAIRGETDTAATIDPLIDFTNSEDISLSSIFHLIISKHIR